MNKQTNRSWFWKQELRATPHSQRQAINVWLCLWRCWSIRTGSMSQKNMNFEWPINTRWQQNWFRSIYHDDANKSAIYNLICFKTHKKEPVDDYRSIQYIMCAWSLFFLSFSPSAHFHAFSASVVRFVCPMKNDECLIAPSTSYVHIRLGFFSIPKWNGNSH